MPMATVKRWLNWHCALVILVATLVSSVTRLLIHGWDWSTGGPLAFHLLALAAVVRLMHYRRKAENAA